MERDSIERLIKFLGIIMLVSLGLKLLGFLISLIFGITTFLLVPLFMIALVVLLPALAIYGLYKLLSRDDKVW
ncbi:MAG: hypothetical protein PUG67_00725 [Peptoniphilaceae bacterium]|nr:hypothetical protein [Peptoniphilaceae bacterium]MDY6019447.1 hypothetical protein [Anaerococcus sp.]